MSKERLKLWRDHPIMMVREEFGVEPDAWQADGLEAFPHNQRLAFKACKGPGKTALLSWLILNFLGTRPHPRIQATSITADNLSQNLWTELAKWLNLSQFFRSRYTWTKTQIFNKQHPATWWAQARAWPKRANAEQLSDALSGLHADYAMGVLDESGGIPQAVMATVEAVLATGIETKVIQAGNPTHLDGPLYRACNQDAKQWYVGTITGDPKDKKRSPRISMEWAQGEIDKYGRDSPWVKVNVLGEFPDASINSLLGVEEVERAMHRHLRKDAYEWSQKRLGVDVARFGDDRTVIFPRQGAAAFKPVIMRNVRTTDIAARVAKAQADWKSEITFVDDTGHWGHGVIDNLVTAGLPAVGIIFSDRALNQRYKNRRAEMWLMMADWVKAGGALPNVREMLGELTIPTYSFIGGKFVLEEKDHIKERLGRSPDIADALALTFAIPDQPGEVMARFQQQGKALRDADPDD